jgi:hypothetical protein
MQGARGGGGGPYTSGWMGERSMPSTCCAVRQSKAPQHTGRVCLHVQTAYPGLGELPRCQPLVIRLSAVRGAVDVPISRHHLPVPQPMSSTRLGRLSGANQFLWPNSAFMMTCCMSSRSFSACRAAGQQQTQQHTQQGRGGAPHRWGTDTLCTG